MCCAEKSFLCIANVLPRFQCALGWESQAHILCEQLFIYERQKLTS